jgi:hypothetical protein
LWLKLSSIPPCRFKAYRTRKLARLARNNAAADKIFRAYLREQNTNYVLLEW